MIDFQIEDFKKQINQALLKYVKGVITNIPEANGIPVIQLERKILEVNDLVETKVKEVLETDFGVTLSVLTWAPLKSTRPAWVMPN